jgi:hypothetical protein
MPLEKELGSLNDNKYFILVLAIVGTIILCALEFWTFAMIYAFATFMLFLAKFFKLV